MAIKIFIVLLFFSFNGYAQTKVDSSKYYYEKFTKFIQRSYYLNNKLLSTNNPKYVRLILSNRDSVDKYHDLLHKIYDK